MDSSRAQKSEEQERREDVTSSARKSQARNDPFVQPGHRPTTTLRQRPNMPESRSRWHGFDATPNRIQRLAALEQGGWVPILNQNGRTPRSSGLPAKMYQTASSLLHALTTRNGLPPPSHSNFRYMLWMRTGSEPLRLQIRIIFCDSTTPFGIAQPPPDGAWLSFLYRSYSPETTPGGTVQVTQRVVTGSNGQEHAFAVIGKTGRRIVAQRAEERALQDETLGVAYWAGSSTVGHTQYDTRFQAAVQYKTCVFRLERVFRRVHRYGGDAFESERLRATQEIEVHIPALHWAQESPFLERFPLTFHQVQLVKTAISAVMWRLMGRTIETRKAARLFFYSAATSASDFVVHWWNVPLLAFTADRLPLGSGLLVNDRFFARFRLYGMELFGQDDLGMLGVRTTLTPAEPLSTSSPASQAVARQQANDATRRQMSEDRVTLFKRFSYANSSRGDGMDRGMEVLVRELRPDRHPASGRPVDGHLILEVTRTRRDVSSEPRHFSLTIRECPSLLTICECPDIVCDL